MKTRLGMRFICKIPDGFGSGGLNIGDDNDIYILPDNAMEPPLRWDAASQTWVEAKFKESDAT